jgi:hypothetical protein
MIFLAIPIAALVAVLLSWWSVRNNRTNEDLLRTGSEPYPNAAEALSDTLEQFGERP